MGEGVVLTGVERTFPSDQFIVSKTDLGGRITYANDVFLDVAGYTEGELIGAPHNIVRHPDMPCCVFNILWNTIGDGGDIIAYVINRAKNGDHYWVMTHVSATKDMQGNVTGYHSTRRVPNPAGVDVMKGIYAKLRGLEKNSTSKKQAIEASTRTLLAELDALGLTYNELIHRLEDGVPLSEAA